MYIVNNKEHINPIVINCNSLFKHLHKKTYNFDVIICRNDILILPEKNPTL